MTDANVRTLTIIAVKGVRFETAIPESIVIGKVGILSEEVSEVDGFSVHTTDAL
jgi:hypothetical protein